MEHSTDDQEQGLTLQIQYDRQLHLLSNIRVLSRGDFVLFK